MLPSSLNKIKILYKIVSDSQLFVDKTMFLEKKAHFFGSKTVDQRSGANAKKTVFCWNLLQIFCFFYVFCTKNAEDDSFDQRLACAAPKRWSKYRTIRHKTAWTFTCKKYAYSLTNKIVLWNVLSHYQSNMLCCWILYLHSNYTLGWDSNWRYKMCPLIVTVAKTLTTKLG